MKEITRAQVRIPKELAEWLKAKAKQESRSMNGQLIEELKAAKDRSAAA